MLLACSCLIDAATFVAGVSVLDGLMAAITCAEKLGLEVLGFASSCSTSLDDREGSQ